jgi:hypothetical protein
MVHVCSSGDEKKKKKSEFFFSFLFFLGGNSSSIVPLSSQATAIVPVDFKIRKDDKNILKVPKLSRRCVIHPGGA